MSFDTKYRPFKFDDVLGQDATVRILRRFLATGTGLKQSYLFVGPYGSGKTTLGRILARGLLCEHPTPEGDPCDQCASCRSFLEEGTSFDFVEVDAATNSGKDDIRKITEEIQYSSFTGRRRIYLLDEAHQLSSSALDALLKPLEEDIPGTGEKRLVCIFCTTEPERMRATIFSRCAPVFVIQPVPPDGIAKKLAYVCQQEGIPYEEDMLRVIAEITECHIRDALKAVEGVALLGGVTRENVTTYLHLDLHNTYLDLLECIGKDLPAAMRMTQGLVDRVSPATIYTKLADLCILAYQVHIGAINPPAFWDTERLKSVGAYHKEALLGMAERFANRPSRPTVSMLSCDLACLHHGGGSGESMMFVARPVQPVQQISDSPKLSETPEVPVKPEVVSPSVPITPMPPAEKSSTIEKVSREVSRIVGTMGTGDDIRGKRNLEGVIPDVRAIAGVPKKRPESSTGAVQTLDDMSPADFARLLALDVRRKQQRATSGPAGSANLGSDRTHPSG